MRAAPARLGQSMDCVNAGRDEHRKQDQHQEGDEGEHNSLTFSTQWGCCFSIPNDRHLSRSSQRL
jgi:hypothetical protein